MNCFPPCTKELIFIDSNFQYEFLMQEVETILELSKIYVCIFKLISFSFRNYHRFPMVEEKKKKCELTGFLGPQNCFRIQASLWFDRSLL